ncbi:hypothetical protein Tco_1415433 [Tanacetum coccineum]
MTIPPLRIQEKRAAADRVDHFMYFQGGLSDGYKNSISEDGSHYSVQIPDYKRMVRNLRRFGKFWVENLITFAIDQTIGIVKEAVEKPRPPSPSRGDWQQVGANDIASEILQDDLRSLE